jgi:integrase/recombinase XerD
VNPHPFPEIGSLKIDRHGKARILTQSEIQLLFSKGLQTARDRALFGICLFSACRINEAVTLKIVDAYDTTSRVRPKLIIRKGNTKGKLATRTIPIIEDLRLILTSYKPNVEQEYLFPGRFSGHIDPESASRILRKAFRRVGIEGASTHSFRRTSLTLMSDAGIPLRIIQEISGHRNLSQLQNYLEVRDDQVLGAVTTLSMLSPAGEEVRKRAYVDLLDNEASYEVEDEWR